MSGVGRGILQAICGRVCLSVPEAGTGDHRVGPSCENAATLHPLLAVQTRVRRSSQACASSLIKRDSNGVTVLLATFTRFPSIWRTYVKRSICSRTQHYQERNKRSEPDDLCALRSESAGPDWERCCVPPCLPLTLPQVCRTAGEFPLPRAGT